MFDYFKKVSNEAKTKGYVVFNNVIKRKFFFDFMDEYRSLESYIQQDGFWTTYRNEKELDSPLFNNILKPKVKKYFRYKGIIERTSYNYPVQGSAADCTKYAAYLFWKWLLHNDFFNIIKFVNIVHDEILIECPDNLAEICSNKLKECMEKAGDYFCKRVPLTAEPQISDRWVH